MLEFLKENGGSLFTLLGVLIGALIASLLTNRIENQKAKRNIKPKLLTTFYKFCNIRKLAIALRNDASYNALTGRMLYIDIHNKLVPDADKVDLRERHNAIVDELQDKSSRLQKIFEDLVNEEAKVLSLVAEIYRYYGVKKYTYFDNVITPHIDKSNLGTEMYDYATMNEQYRQISSTYKQKLKERLSQMDVAYKEVSSKIITHLK